MTTATAPVPDPPLAPAHHDTPDPETATASGLPYGPGWWALEADREPPQGSVVLTSSPTGTAWQRHHAGSLWHPTVAGARPLRWSDLCRRYAGRWAAVVYVAPPR